MGDDPSCRRTLDRVLSSGVNTEWMMCEYEKECRLKKRNFSRYERFLMDDDKEKNASMNFNDYWILFFFFFNHVQILKRKV